MKCAKWGLLMYVLSITSITFGQTEKTSEMTTEQKKELVVKFTEFMANKKLQQFGEVISEDYKQHNPLIKQGLEGIVEGSTWFLAIFPDLSVSIDHILVEGDLVMGHFTWSGTQKEAFMGIPASNVKATWKSMDIWRIEGNKLAEHWDVVDWAGLIQQIQAKK